MVRVTLGGAGLDGFAITSPTGHIKLFLPADGDTEPALPTFGADGIEWPAGRPRSVMRTYTPRRFDPSRLELDVEFFLHGVGPASRWAASATVGDRAAIAGPGRGYHPDPAAGWFLIAGDESAIPAIGMIVESLPEGAPARVVVEVTSTEDEQPLPRRHGVTTEWLHRDGRQPGELLEETMRGARLPSRNGRAWVAAEASRIRAIRRHLVTDGHLAPEHVVTRGYWRAGHPDHPDHDYGDTAA